MSWHTLEKAAEMLHRSTGHVRRQCRRWEKQRKAKLRRRNGRKASWMIHSSVLGETCDPLTRAGVESSDITPRWPDARAASAPMSIPPDSILIVIPPGSAAAAGKLFNVTAKDV